MMTRIFDDAKDKYVNAVVLFADNSSVLHFDEDAEDDGVSAADLKDLFEKGLVLVKTDDGEFRPTVLTDETTYYAVSLIVMGASVAEALTFKSATIE